MEGSPGDTEEISIQVVFQGGGAKLVVLVAAAKVIFDEKTRLGLRLSRISGTSAGAIAGCILATGKDPELFRKDILRLAPLYLPQIQKQIGWTRSLDVMRGVPLFDATQYREFLRELFISSGKVSHLKKLTTPVLFHATNIKNGASKMFDGSREEDTIEEALFCSSALPYIFETFKGQPYVDGGLISNFPAYSLKQPGFEKDQIIGFSFPATDSYPFQAGLISYSKSLMFTTMDLSVARARGELPPENVYEFQTRIGTLDFDKALAHLRDDIEFENYKRQARSFLEEFVSRQRAKREIEVRTKDIEDESKRALEEEKIKHEQELGTIYSSVRAYHDQVCSTSPFKILKKTIVNTCNALRSNDKKTLDFLSVTDVFIPTNKTVTGYGAVIMIGNKSADVEAIRPQLLRLREEGIAEQEPRHTVTSIRIPIGPQSSFVNYSNVMFFFHPSLEESPGTTYELSFSCQHAAMFDDIIDGKSFDTYIYGAKTKSVDQLQIVCLFPENLEMMLVSVPEDKRSDKVGELGDWCKRWVAGSQTPLEELRHHNKVPGFKALGWQCGKLAIGDATGFRAVRG